jgi:hypothetical protein
MALKVVVTPQNSVYMKGQGHFRDKVEDGLLTLNQQD